MNSMSLVRTFVAVVPPEDILDQLGHLVDRLHRLPSASCKWVSRAQLHLTLRFLGESSQAQTDIVAKALGKVTGAAFEITLNRVGGFPSLRQPRVLWLGGVSGVEHLAALAAKVEEAAVVSGFPPETRAFDAHLTLARVRRTPSSPFPPELTEALKTVPSFTWRVSRFFLVQSNLTPQGSIYTTLHEYSLTQSAPHASPLL